MFKPYLIKNVTYPLDGLSVAEAVSVSRQLTKNHKKAFNVERSNDSATLDVGFRMNGELDISKMMQFVGVNTGVINKLYGVNGNVFQANIYSKKPRIINAGTLETINGKPALYFDGSNDALWCDNATNIDITAQPLYLAYVITPDLTIANTSYIICKNTDDSSNISFGVFYDVGAYVANSTNFVLEGISDNVSSAAANAVPKGQLKLGSATWQNNVMTSYVNSVASGGTDTYSSTLNSRNSLTFGSRQGAGVQVNFFKGKLAEVHILRGNPKQSNFEQKIKKYYNI